ncbi:ADP-ribosylglycohydrolase family protein [Mesorhizobium sp. LHD-90]|uniref:ADP-ribosylglycohydrolase family protein n=1 Tax=Mesorhizobium sp. LHD-90 TaxID=3071414 RepID=UPI0027E0FA0C|nr:ADP-ribosylglycohydrolase family protein [Mesorhizobium sp. LHD-90]MDQ6437067.1 ADP-ribosylglycohydrolase family protein [Mesorhizobium sp. LHD-90]
MNQAAAGHSDEKRDRAIGAFVGLAVGDAVGTTLEFKTRDSFEPITDMVGGGPFRLKPGEWTDDTSMALCLADSLIARGGRVDAKHLLASFWRWFEFGENSVTGECFDIGNATRRSLGAFERDGSLVNNTEEHMQANGSIMRLAPAVVCATSRANARELAQTQGRTTHAAPVPDRCCAELAETLWNLIETGILPESVIALHYKRRDEIVSSGHAPATLDAARWCVATTSDFREAVLLAANLGDDADTVGAVTGQIAGARYGLAGIPEDWLAKLAWRDDIVERAERLWALRETQSS